MTTPIGSSNWRSLNTAISGLKVSFSHIHRLHMAGVLNDDVAAGLALLIDELDAVRDTVSEN